MYSCGGTRRCLLQYSCCMSSFQTSWVPPDHFSMPHSDVALSILFLWSSVSTFINKPPPRIPEVHLPEGPFLQIASVLRIEINQTFAVLQEIASGRDLKKFLAFVLLHTVPCSMRNTKTPIAEKGMIEIKKHYAVFDAKVLSKIPRGLSKEKKTE